MCCYDKVYWELIKSAVNISVFWCQGLAVRQLNILHKSKEWCCFFERIIFNCLHWIKKKRLSSTVDLFSVITVILFKIYKIYKRFYLFQGGFEVSKLQYFKLPCQWHIQHLLKYLRWSFFLKAVKSFRRTIHLRFLGFE